jgi:hypothetical protein
MPYIKTRTQTSCRTPVFTPTVVQTKLEKLQTEKSMGVDGINGNVLKNCAKSLAVPLSLIYSKSLSCERCPEIWKRANVTPLFKKGSRLDPGNYRPISLTSIVCKVMEKIIRDSITDHLVVENLINTSQHGFVDNKACVTN